MKERRLYPPGGDRGDFDPFVEGARYRLGSDVLWALWQRACEQSEREGDLDRTSARRRFHALAAHAQVGRPALDVGRMTRVEWEQSAFALTRDRNGGCGVPGRETRVETEATRGSAIQRKADDSAVPGTLTEIPAPTGAGQPLPASVRRIMGRVFGVDFSSVRVHVGPEAAAVGALAYARGNDLYFSPGHYDPVSPRGLSLLGHELAHVIQQAEGRVRPTHRTGGIAVNDSVGLEREADELGARAARIAREAPVQAPTRPSSRLRSLASGADRVLQRQAVEPSAGAPPPPPPRREPRFQAIARLLEEWRAAGLLDPPARPPDVEAFPSIPPPRVGTIRAADGKVVAAGAAAPALAPRWAPGPEPAPGPVRPNLRLVPESPPTSIRPVPPPLLSPGVLAVAVAVVILLWPSETAPAWMDELSPLTGAPYGSPDEFTWTSRLSPRQMDYLRRLLRERERRGPVISAPHPEADGHAAPVPDAPPVAVLDGDKKRDEELPKADFYHGTDLGTATGMAAGAPIKALGHGEFGAGFYTFRMESAAAEAAEVYTRNRNAGFSQWGVVDFSVPANVLAEFLAASEVAALLTQKLSRILFFPDKTTSVTVRYPREQNGLELSHTWDEFVKVNAKLGRHTAWPYDLIIGPLKGKLRSQKAGVDQWVFGEAGVLMFQHPKVKRRVSSSGDL